MLLNVFILFNLVYLQLSFKNEKSIRKPTNSTLDEIYSQSKYRIKLNINPQGSIPGTIVASPSKTDPDYFYDWVRDSALVYHALNSQEDIKEYIKSIQVHQKVDNFGEPKFYVDGRVFDGPWGRPQTDGPGLRVITLHSYIKEIIKNGGDIKDLHHLYNPNYPPTSVIKKDLEYIVHNHSKESFDLWEEVYGSHFYNLMIHQRALELGSELADLFKDPGASKYYKLIRFEIQKKLNDFWDDDHWYIKSIRGKDRLDIAFVLACLHTSDSDFKLYSCKSERILISLAKLHVSFQMEYPINYGQKYILYGRYSSDVYDGNKMTLGNPWVLSTLGVAELLYRIVYDFYIDKSIIITGKNQLFYQYFVPGLITKPQRIDKSQQLFMDILVDLVNVADGMIDRVLSFGTRFSEQIDRKQGFMRGAKDLSWAYASFLTAYEARQRASEIFKIQ